MGRDVEFTPGVAPDGFSKRRKALLHDPRIPPARAIKKTADDAPVLTGRTRLLTHYS
jgi:hypothetical protein